MSVPAPNSLFHDANSSLDPLLVPEVSDSSKNHSQIEPVGCVNDFLVTNRASGLNDRRCAGSCHRFKTVRKREEGVRRNGTVGQRQNSFHGAKLGGIHPAHLPSPYTQGLAIAGIDDGVRLDVLGHFPGKSERLHLLWRWLAL